MRNGQLKASKVKRGGHHQTLQEREEIREYLARLRQIVPACPKDGKISRLDLIQHVIDYIVQLQDTLMHHPINRLLGGGPEGELGGVVPPSALGMPNTPPLSPNPMLMMMAQSPSPRSHMIPNVSCGATTKSSKKRQSSSSSGSSSCRRPLGVLSSLNQHRNL